MNFKNLKLNKRKITALAMMISLSFVLNGCGNSNKERPSNDEVISSTTYNDQYLEDLEEENVSLKEELIRLQENNEKTTYTSQYIEDRKDENTSFEEDTENIETISIEELYLGAVTDINTDEKELYIFKENPSYIDVYDEYNYSFEALYNAHPYGEECYENLCNRYAHIFKDDIKPLSSCLTEEQQESIINNERITNDYLEELLNELRDTYHKKKNKKLIKK